MKTSCFVVLFMVIIVSALAFSRGRSAESLYRHESEGSVHGTVLLLGKPLPNKKIDESADPACTAKRPRATTEWIVSHNGRLANVFVYLKDGHGLQELRFDPPSTHVILDQQGCRFVPHVAGIQVNQTLEIRNSDPTTHNVHDTPRSNPDWNQSQAAGAGPLLTRFARPEVMIPIKCNQHPWMKAYVGVLPHPFFAVTDRNGLFNINGIPPGDYTIAAWHEEFGEQTQAVRIEAGAANEVRFNFRTSDQRTRH